MMKNIKIRNVTNKDLAEFLEIYVSAYRDLEDYSYKKSREIKRYFKWLLKRDLEGFFLIETDNKVLGFVASDSNWYSKFENSYVLEIHELIVRKEFQNKGFGKKLLERVLLYGKEKNLKIGELFVGKENKKAILFYIKNGFVKKETYKKWIRMTRSI